MEDTLFYVFFGGTWLLIAVLAIFLKERIYNEVYVASRKVDAMYAVMIKLAVEDDDVEKVETNPMAEIRNNLGLSNETSNQ